MGVSASDVVNGTVASGWEPVAEAFRRNFEDANELGAAVAVYVGAQCVVDLWGGIADARSQLPWESGTVVPVFSSTKGATAICAHLLVERGLLDIDAPVSTYWPEFAQAGKERLPVRWLLTHQAGLPYVDDDLGFEQLRAEEPVIRALELQTPIWEPGSSFAYHAVTFGHLVGELIRRVSGRPLAEFFAEEVARPLDLQSWMALPEETPVALAHLERVKHEIPPGVAAFFGPESTFGRAITLGHALPLELVNGEPGDFNDRRLLAVTLGGSSMVSDARSLARLYAATVAEVDGVRLLGEETVRRASVVQTRDLPYHGWPEALPHLMDFALGFQNGGALGPTSFGHGGAGGSLAFGALEAGVGFGYVMNRMDATAPDSRSASLVAAVGSCLASNL